MCLHADLLEVVHVVYVCNLHNVCIGSNLFYHSASVQTVSLGPEHSVPDILAFGKMKSVFLSFAKKKTVDFLLCLLFQ